MLKVQAQNGDIPYAQFQFYFSRKIYAYQRIQNVKYEFGVDFNVEKWHDAFFCDIHLKGLDMT